MKDDTISRTAALDALNGLTEIYLNNLPPTIYKEDAIKAVKALPPAHPSVSKTEIVEDTISRQAAIKAICEDGTMFERQGKYTMTMAERKQKDADILDSLPSAQPGWTTDVNNILAYLDGTVHPLVSPENWNVYSELYDMVSGLLKPWEGKQDGEG